MVALPALTAKTKIIAAAVAGAMLVSAGGAYALFSGGNETVLSYSDFTELAPQQQERISVSGVLDPANSVTIGTHLTAPISAINVKVGDRVTARQLLGTLNTQAFERELAQQNAQDATAAASAYSQITAAQRDLQRFREMTANGTHPEIDSAQRALRDAERTYNHAVEDFEHELSRPGGDPQVRSQQDALVTSREQFLNTIVAASRTGVGMIYDNRTHRRGIAELEQRRAQLAASTEPDKQESLRATIKALEDAIVAYERAQANQVFEGIDAANQIAGAARALEQQQLNFEDTLHDLDHKLVEQQREINQAFEARADAATDLEMARRTLAYEDENKVAAVNDALRTAEAQRQGAEAGSAQLRLDIASAEIHSPIDGVVLNVAAVQGKPASGDLFTVADDSSLIIRTTIREGDVSRVKVGQEVEFSSPVAPEKTFKGRVTFVSPVAAQAASSGESTSGGSFGGDSSGGSGNRASFPIEITVQGDREGLRVGNTAKARILLDKPGDELVVQPEAVWEEDGTSYVMVVEDNVVVQREVTVAQHPAGVAISGDGIVPGARVLNYADMRETYLGETVVLDDFSFGDFESTESY